MDRANLKKILIAYHNGSISEAETKLLCTYIYTGSEADAEVLRSVLAELVEELDEDFSIPVLSEHMYKNIVTDPRFLTKQGKNITVYKWIASVAAVVLLLMGAIWSWRQNDVHSFLGKYRASSVRMVTTSPTDRLMLKVSDGTTYDIDDLIGEKSSLIDNAPFSIKGNEITYDKNSSSGTSVSMVHTLATPKGRQFKVILSDGTKVWLNAATVLKFPTHFDPKERTVEVDGEAYFEVEKSKDWPFVVHSVGQQIKVLGTHFNVHAYKEDQKSYTTLIEGKVEVSTAEERTILAPDQQVVSFYDRGNLSVNRVVGQDVVAWKDDLFVFDDEEIQDVMRQVSRWYDVAVEYQDGMEGKHIAGSIPRYKNIGQLMDGLAATGLLNYKIKGGTVIISK